MLFKCECLSTSNHCIASVICGTQVSARTRGKGKLGSMADELQALYKKAKLEVTSNRDAPIEIAASPDRGDFMNESSQAVPVQSPHSPETIRKRRALKSLSLYMAEREFCEGSSERSEEIAKYMAEFADKGALDIDYDLLVKKSVFASFQV